MQPTLTEETAVVEQADLVTCITCGSNNILHGFPNAFCAECREKFIKFPLPTWIKAFGAGVAAIVIFSLFSFFENLQTGIHMARGVKAEKAQNFVTAQREFEEVLKKVPNHIEAKAHLLIAAYYNEDVAKYAATANQLQGKTFDDQDLFDEADNVLSMGNNFFPSDSLNALEEKYKTDSTKEAAVITDYYSKNPTDVSAGLKIASDALDKEDYTRADTLLQKILNNHPQNLVALTLMSAVKRYRKDAAGALTYIDELLALNKEQLYAISSKARVMVMMNKDVEALKLAEKADRLDHSFGFNQATLAIVYHYMHKLKERDAIVNAARAAKDSSVMGYMQYALDIISNKEKLRS